MVINLGPDDCCSVPPAAAPLDDGTRDRLVSVFRALADPTRLDIFRLIAGQPQAICVCEIVDRFPVSQPTISHHLRVLRDARLVTVSRRGVWAYYGATDEGRRVLDEVSQIVEGGGVAVPT